MNVIFERRLIFGEEGRLINMMAERYNEARGRMLPWSTPIRAYGEFSGIRVPVEGEGAWKYESDDFTYIRLRITELEYNQAAEF